MSKQKKKRQIIYDLLNAQTKPKFLHLLYTKKQKLFTEKVLFNVKWGREGLIKK